MTDGDWRERLSEIAQRLGSASILERVLISFAALVTSMLVGVVIVLLAGLPADCGSPFLSTPLGDFCYDPIEVYSLLFIGAIENEFNLSITLAQTTLLAITGVSVAVAFKAGLFNIGGQGQLVLGGLAGAQVVVWAVPYAPTGLSGSVVLIPLALLVAAIVGAIWAIIPGILLAYRDANEVITTIMLNFIAAGIGFALVKGFLKPPETQSVRTGELPEYAQLRPIAFMDGVDFSIIALGIGLALCVGIYWMLKQTSFGFEILASGTQAEAAEYGGVNSKRIIITTMGISGAIAGIAGIIYVLMLPGFWRTFIPSLGFDGITVSILAGNNPLGVLPAAFLFGVLKSGSQLIDFGLGVPRQLVGVLRALIILFVAMPEFFRMGVRRWGWFLPEGGN
jgi:simple sugar transport system permease protein